MSFFCRVSHFQPSRMCLSFGEKTRMPMVQRLLLDELRVMTEGSFLNCPKYITILLFPCFFPPPFHRFLFFFPFCFLFLICLISPRAEQISSSRSQSSSHHFPLYVWMNWRNARINGIYRYILRRSSSISIVPSFSFNKIRKIRVVLQPLLLAQSLEDQFILADLQNPSIDAPTL